MGKNITLLFLISSRMSDQHERLILARKSAGYIRQADAIRAFGWNRNTYKSNENGNGVYSFDQAKAYARAFRVRAEWLYDGSGAMKSERSTGIPIVGSVAAGAEGFFENDADIPHDFIDAYIPDASGALLVKGDSMFPRFKDGDKIIVGRRFDDPMECVNSEVFVQVKGGQKLLKKLQKGSEVGKWNLVSVNASYPPIENVEIDWVLPVTWVMVNSY